MSKDTEIEEFLINFTKEYFNQGSDYFARKSKSGYVWIFGYTNDYPLQHGKGETYNLPHNMVLLMMKKIKK